MSKKNINIIKHIMSQKWLMEPDELSKLVAITTREYSNVEEALDKISEREGFSVSNNLTGNVGVIDFFGTSFRRANLFTETSGCTDLQSIGEQLRSMVKDSNIKSIIINFDSPGGEVAGVSELGSLIKELSSVKPIIAHVSDMAASAAYWLASQTNFINMSPTATVGSIGVICTVYVQEGEASPKTFVSANAPLKRMGPNDEGFDEKMQSTVDDLEQLFLEAVASGRNTTVESVINNFGNGDTFFAKKAIDLGMADKIGSLDNLINMLNDNKFDMLQNGNTSSIIIQANADNQNEVLSMSEVKVETKDIEKEMKDKEMKDQSALINNLLAMSTGHREYMENLDQAQKLEFAAMSNLEREALVIKNHDPVVYTTIDGEEIKASHGRVALEKVIELDVMKSRNKELEKLAHKNSLIIKADQELPNLPGTNDVKAELLGLIENMEDGEAKNKIMNSLKANNANMASAFETKGTSTQSEANSDNETFENMVEDYMNKHSCSVHVARSKVATTSHGAGLYNKMKYNKG